jgi:hypothetical protein
MIRVRSPAPVAAGLAVAGCLIGGAIALAGSPPYRASTTIVVEVNGVPANPTAKDAVPTIAALAVSNVVVENVADAMKLGTGVVRSHLRASVVPGTALIRVGYDDPSDVRARQLAQEAASALQAVVAAHFGARLSVGVADPLSSSRLGHPWLDDALFGALAGALLGIGWEAVVHFRSRPATERPARVRPERAPPKERAAKQPKQAKQPKEPKPKRVKPQRVPKPKRVRPEPAPALRAVEPATKPVPAPVPAPAPQAPPPSPEPAPSGRVADLRRALAAHRDEFDSDQIISWEASLGALEAQAVDGKLSPALESLALDLFEPLIALDGKPLRS